MIELDRIERVRSLISLGETEGSDVMETAFENMGNELHVRAMAFGSIHRLSREHAKLGILADSFKGVGMRLTDIFFRLVTLELIRSEIAKVPEKERLAILMNPQEGENFWK